MASPYSNVVLADAPTTWYRLGDSGSVAADSAGTLPGVYQGAVAHVAGLLDGDTDKAAGFSQASIQAVLITDSAGMLAPGSLTVEVVVKANSFPTGSRIVQNDPNDGRWRMLSSGGRINWAVPGKCDITMSTVLDTNRHHVVGTYDAATGNSVLYLDGAVVGSASATAGPCGFGTGFVGIGQKPNGTANGDGFDGVIDEVAIYSKALSLARVSVHYAAVSPIFFLPNADLVGVAWVGGIAGVSPGQVATILPEDNSSWSASGFVELTVVGGSPGVDGAHRGPVYEVSCWASNPNSSKAPWGKAFTLAELVIAGCYPLNPMTASRTVTLPAGFENARVMSAYPLSEPRRIENDDSSYARVQFDLQLNWVRVLAT